MAGFSSPASPVSWPGQCQWRRANTSRSAPKPTPRALRAHSRDELGISDTLSARPVQAALASAGTFAVGAAMPLLLAVLVPTASLVLGRVGGLTVLPGSPRRTGGTRRRIPVFKSVLRVTFWGALAMALTAGVGALFGATV